MCRLWSCSFSLYTYAGSILVRPWTLFSGWPQAQNLVHLGGQTSISRAGCMYTRYLRVRHKRCWVSYIRMVIRCVWLLRAVKHDKMQSTWALWFCLKILIVCCTGFFWRSYTQVTNSVHSISSAAWFPPEWRHVQHRVCFNRATNLFGVQLLNLRCLLAVFRHSVWHLYQKFLLNC